MTDEELDELIAAYSSGPPVFGVHRDVLLDMLNTMKRDREIIKDMSEKLAYVTTMLDANIADLNEFDIPGPYTISSFTSVLELMRSKL